ncbi:TraB/VirB10 family protein [Cronobacter sakazakii]|nr:TraB/VirB10 family protein [Cronobacter sakazakii]
MNDNKFPVIERARAWFHRQPSAKQKQIKKYGTISAFAIVFLGVYYMTGQDKGNIRPPENKVDITPDKTGSLIQDDIVTTLGSKIDDASNNIDKKVGDAVAKAIQEGKFNLTAPPAPTTPADSTAGATDPLSGNEAPKNTSDSNGRTTPAEYPGVGAFPPPAGYTDAGGGQSTSNSQADEEPKTLWVGSISEDNGEIPLSDTAQETTEKKNQIQLPVGFMKAKLLVGVNALTGQYGSENPQTLMFRVQAPAQLPNFIKMNLRGCFSIANASGNLSSERIIVLPVSIHCMTMDGRYIVEGEVKGFVSDRDGKRDMSARVVSRAGRLLASTVFAKSIEGFANVIGNQSIQQNVSPLGSINTVKPDEASKNAAATGVAGGFNEVSKYLLNLAQQTSPALETGPGKDVTLFIQETAELTIKQVRIK